MKAIEKIWFFARACAVFARLLLAPIWKEKWICLDQILFI